MTQARSPSLRHRIELGFEAWGRLVVRRARLVVLVSLLASAAAVSQLPHLRADNSIESFLLEDDPALERYDEFRERFDRDDRIVVALDPADSVYDLAFLERLRALHRDLEASLPHVAEVTSLVNARSTWGRGDELVVEDLLEQWPRNDADLERIRARVEETPLYRNLLVSADGGFTTVVIEPSTFSSSADSAPELGGFGDESEGTSGNGGGQGRPYLSDAETAELVHALRSVVDRHRSEDLPLYVVGGPFMNVALTEHLTHDVSVFMSLSILATAGMLALLFRRASGVILPLVVILTALVNTLGLVALLDVPFSMTLQILPAFLVAVGICDSVHLLVITYRRLALGDTIEDAIAFSLRHSGLAILMTSLTTAGSLLSFLVAELRPVHYLGLVAPLGVMLAFAYAVSLLPALLALFPVKALSRPESRPGGRLSDRVLTRLGDFATGHPYPVLGVTGLLLVLAGAGIAQLHFGHDALRWFPPDDPLRRSSEAIDAHIEGVSTLEFVIDTGRDFGLYEPEALEHIDAGVEWARHHRDDGLAVASAISIVDIVKETHRALNENRQAYYAIPAERDLLAQELLLFEQSGSDDLEEVTDGRFRLARLTLRVPWVDAMVYPAFIGRIEQGLRERFGPRLDFSVTGTAEIFSRSFRALILSLGRSYAVALAVIVPLMVLLIGSLERGLVAMVPNLVPVALTLGLMGWLGIPLDASTLLIGAIIIGLAVDDTIHFMHKFSRYLEDLGDPRAAVHETLLTTGSALLFTSLALGVGFGVLLFAYMANAQEFGLLALFALGVAFAADIVLGPALMLLVTRRRPPPATDLAVS
jgi:predicted RND superfamily exporter protein